MTKHYLKYGGGCKINKYMAYIALILIVLVTLVATIGSSIISNNMRAENITILEPSNEDSNIPKELGDIYNAGKNAQRELMPFYFSSAFTAFCIIIAGMLNRYAVSLRKHADLFLGEDDIESIIKVSYVTFGVEVVFLCLNIFSAIGTIDFYMLFN